MNRDELAAAWKSLRDLPFPPPPEDSDLADWLFELLEMDSFYAGIAQSVLSGDKSTRLPQRDELDGMIEDLRLIRVASPQDEEVLEECRTYMATLERLHQALLT